jgi:hypothetical protein
MNSAGSIILCAGLSVLAVDSGGESDTSVGHAILVDADKARYVVGEPINVSVVYRNSSEAPWRMVQPDTCTSVRYTLDGKKNSIGSYTFRKVTTVASYDADGGRFDAYLAPKAKWLVIPPGKEHRLEADIYFGQWLGHLGPGEWVVWAHHPILDQDSNRFKFRIDFTRDSVSTILDLVRDPATPASQTRSFAKWLQKLKPDLIFEWPVWSDTAEQYERKSRLIEDELDRFADWWKQQSGSKTVEKRISTINQNAISSLRYNYRACR